MALKSPLKVNAKTEPCRRIQDPEPEYRVYFEPIRREVFGAHGLVRQQLA